MSSLKDEAIQAISAMPDSVGLDDIMYRLYVIEKIHRGQEAVARGEVLSVDELRKDIASWM